MGKWSIGKSATLTDIAMCINKYRILTPGLYACINIGVKINGQIEYPDLIVMVNSGNKKQCEPDYENNYFNGPPNFIVDIEEDTSSAFLKNRKKLFAFSGVEEYLIVNEALTKIEWNRLIKDEFQEIYPDDDGIIKSSGLPGLWIPINELKKRNYWAVMASIEHGTTRTGHHKLMQTIWKKD
jgi:hypothetical protein